MTGLAPIGHGFFNKSGLGIMLREELWLTVYELGKIGRERSGDLRVQLLTSAAQQAAMRRVLHQCVLEGVECVGWCAALEDQLGSDEPGESGFQLVIAKARDGMQQLI